MSTGYAQTYITGKTMVHFFNTAGIRKDIQQLEYNKNIFAKIIQFVGVMNALVAQSMSV